MTRKYFKAITQAIHDSIADKQQRKATACALIAVLQSTNTNFNAERFLMACTGSKVQS